MAAQRKNWKEEFESLAKTARKLAKRANQRMVRLEKYQKKDLYSEILDFAYEEAQKNIKNLYGKKGENLRFTETQRLVDVSDGTKMLSGAELYKKNVQMLRQKVAAMEQFLEAKSSTKRGMDEVLDKRTNTINTDKKFQMSKYGVSLTKDELKRFFDSKQQEKLADKVGSASMFIVAAEIKKNNLQTNKRALLRFIKKNINTKDREKLQKEGAFNEKIYEDKDEVLEKLWEYVKITGNGVLDDYIKTALENGINAKNLFI